MSDTVWHESFRDCVITALKTTLTTAGASSVPEQMADMLSPSRPKHLVILCALCDIPGDAIAHRNDPKPDKSATSEK